MGSWCAWIRQSLVPLSREDLLDEWRDESLSAQAIATEIETAYWKSHLDPPNGPVRSLAHFANLKKTFDKEEYFIYPNRKVAAAMARPRLGSGPWRVYIAGTPPGIIYVYIPPGS